MEGDAMRRLFGFLTALFLLSGLVGCQHTCGVCDCDCCSGTCCCTCAGYGYRSACGVSYGPMPKAEQVGMPKPDDKKDGDKKDTEKKEEKTDKKETDKLPPEE
jgi:hypothetical protein